MDNHFDIKIVVDDFFEGAKLTFPKSVVIPQSVYNNIINKHKANADRLAAELGVIAAGDIIKNATLCKADASELSAIARAALAAHEEAGQPSTLAMHHPDTGILSANGRYSVRETERGEG